MKRFFWRRLYKWSDRRLVSDLPVGLLWPTTDDASVCWPKLEEALRLLATHDPRRFERLKRHTEGVLVFGAAGGLGKWQQATRLVILRETYVTATATTPADVASTLVHEATHAWLDQLGFDYREDRRQRIEAICFRSEIAFARKLPAAGDLVERAERQLARDPAFWSDRAMRTHAMTELHELGVPWWLVRLLEWVTRRRVV